MSADRWSMCPGCKKKAEQKRKDLLKQIEDGYGKIPADEFMELVERSAQPQKPLTLNTLREDWEIGIYEGEFGVDYYASCEECGFSYVFKHTEKVSDDAD